MKKLLLVLALAGATLTGAQAADWYLVGNKVNNGVAEWNDNANLKMTQSADDANVFTFEIPELSGEFKIKEANNWLTALSSNGNKLKEGELYNCGRNGGNIMVDGIIKNATITANVQAGTVLVTGQSAENEYSTVYLIGNLNDGGWKEDITTFPLALEEGSTNAWKGTFTFTAANNYFKMKAGNFIYGTGGNDIKVEMDKEYTASQSGNAYNIGAGEYEFTFVLDKNADIGKLTVKAKEIVPVQKPVYYLRGVSTNWEANDQSKMTENDGVYTITLPKLMGAFKIAEAEWNDATTISTANAAMELDTEYDAYHSIADMGMAKSLTDATITFDFNTMKLKVTGTEYVPAVSYAINSDLTNSDWSREAMTQEGDVWTYKVTPINATGKMQVVKMLDAEPGTYMGNATETISVENAEVEMVAGAEDLKYSLTAGDEYIFTFDPATAILSVKSTVVPPVPVEYPELYYRGVLNDWGFDDASKMTRNEDVYTITLEKLSGAFKLADATWSADNSWTSNNMTMELDTEYVCESRDNAPNMGTAKNLLNATITFNYTTKTLKISGTVDETPVVVTYQLKGSFSDPAWTPVDMTLNETSKTYDCETVIAAETGELLVAELHDGVESAWWKGSEADTLEDDIPVFLSNTGSSNVPYILEGCKDKKVLFKFNPETGELYVDTSVGVDSILSEAEGAAIYFTIDGARVENPSEGLYIRVENGRARKVIIK